MAPCRDKAEFRRNTPDLHASSPLAVIVRFSLYFPSLLFFFLVFVLHLVGLSRQGLDGTEMTRTYLEEGDCFVAQIARF